MRLNHPLKLYYRVINWPKGLESEKICKRPSKSKVVDISRVQFFPPFTLCFAFKQLGDEKHPGARAGGAA
jgi:hypothetical protein